MVSFINHAGIDEFKSARAGNCFATDAMFLHDESALQSSSFQTPNHTSLLSKEYVAKDKHIIQNASLT